MGCKVQRADGSEFGASSLAQACAHLHLCFGVRACGSGFQIWNQGLKLRVHRVLGDFLEPCPGSYTPVFAFRGSDLEATCGLGFRVWGSGLKLRVHRVWDKFLAQACTHLVWSLEFGVWRLGFRVWVLGLGFEVWSLGFGV